MVCQKKLLQSKTKQDLLTKVRKETKYPERKKAKTALPGRSGGKSDLFSAVMLKSAERHGKILKYKITAFEKKVRKQLKREKGFSKLFNKNSKSDSRCKRREVFPRTKRKPSQQRHIMGKAVDKDIKELKNHMTHATSQKHQKYTQGGVKGHGQISNKPGKSRVKRKINWIGSIRSPLRSCLKKQKQSLLERTTSDESNRNNNQGRKVAFCDHIIQLKFAETVPPSKMFQAARPKIRRDPFLTDSAWSKTQEECESSQVIQCPCGEAETQIHAPEYTEPDDQTSENTTIENEARTRQTAISKCSEQEPEKEEVITPDLSHVTYYEGQIKYRYGRVTELYPYGNAPIPDGYYHVLLDSVIQVKAETGEQDATGLIFPWDKDSFPSSGSVICIKQGQVDYLQLRACCDCPVPVLGECHHTKNQSAGSPVKQEVAALYVGDQKGTSAPNAKKIKVEGRIEMHQTEGHDETFLQEDTKQCQPVEEDSEDVEPPHPLRHILTNIFSPLRL